MSLFSIGRKVELRAGIESLRNVLIWLHPLSRVVMEISHVYSDGLPLQYGEAALESGVLCHCKPRGDSNRGLYPESLCDTVAQITTVSYELFCEENLLPFLV